MKLEKEKINAGIDTLIKFIGAITGLFYVTGLIIDSIYFSKFGIIGVDFLSPQYILAGGVFYLITLFCSSPFFLYITWYLFWFEGPIDIAGPSGMKRHIPFFRLKVVSYFVMLTITFVLIPCAISSILLKTNALYNLRFLLIYGASSLTLATSIFLTIKYNPTSVNEWRRDNVLVMYFRSVSQLFVWVVYLYSYSYFLFPLLSPTFGGGHSSKIKIYLKQEDYPIEMNRVLNINDSIMKQVPSFNLIKENSESYFITYSDSPNVRILPKRLTKAVMISN